MESTRRIELMNRLKQENRPLSGAELAKAFGVSRQVIVQDIALLRATNRNILSTNKGYVLYDSGARSESVPENFCSEPYRRTDAGGTVSDG